MRALTQASCVNYKCKSVAKRWRGLETIQPSALERFRRGTLHGGRGAGRRPVDPSCDSGRCGRCVGPGVDGKPRIPRHRGFPPDRRRSILRQRAAKLSEDGWDQPTPRKTQPFVGTPPLSMRSLTSQNFGDARYRQGPIRRFLGRTAFPFSIGVTNERLKQLTNT